MSNNNLSRLNDFLFEHLERLSAPDILDKELEKETNRTAVLASTSKQVINNAALVLEAEKTRIEYVHAFKNVPKMLQNREEPTK